MRARMRATTSSAEDEDAEPAERLREQLPPAQRRFGPKQSRHAPMRSSQALAGLKKQTEPSTSKLFNPFMPL